MQLAIHRVRKHPAQHVDVCEAAARAVVALLDDPRARPVDGVDPATDPEEPTGSLAGRPSVPWSEAIGYWRTGWIRKVVRRAENKRWVDAQSLGGVTVTTGELPAADAPEFADGDPQQPTLAEVRAFVPGPLHPLPPELAKLQVGGTEFPRERGSLVTHALVGIELSPLAPMSTGKSAAQAGHAAQLIYEQLDPVRRDRWRADGFRVRVCTPSTDEWEQRSGDVAVVDAGLTELDGPTETARAHWTG